ncbi:hypothetical protein STCU_01640 [Strigomonas culicis]|uniref:Uncharacterized protein n=1 Tax=Strigomonas culicis TaxID=28005 RepID=S9WF18_9TRYP|nr:hypothetical protein STCU_01640 [Strigomonas culicis]|eukprot:EPY34330.1 hypothetical protein STCU_01640 [Strigomonas culicis]
MSAGGFSEDFFYAVLQHCNPSAARIDGVTRVALRHLPFATEMWSAIRRVLMEQTDLDGPVNRALWCLVDALLKHAPLVFVPLMGPRLVEYAVQHMPWRLVQGSGEVWCERMVRTWEGVVPPAVYSAVRRHAVQCRSEADLDGALHARQAQGELEGGAAATPAQVRQLFEEWDALKYLCVTTASATRESGGLGCGGPPSRTAPFLSRPHAARGWRRRGTDEDEEDDYVPDFVKGAKPRELPKLDIQVRRKPRRRAREDDDL